MSRILPLLLAHLTIGRRTAIQGQGPARFFTPCLYLALAFLPLLFSLTQDTKYGKGLIIVYYSVVTFTMGLMRDGKKNNVWLHQIRIYPLSDPLIFRFLWVIELLDYTLIMFFVPAVGGILLLYPDTRLILLFLVSMGLSYTLNTLFVSASKLLISHYASGRTVAALFHVALYLALLASWRVVESNLDFIHEFTSSWKTQAAFFGIVSGALISLYRAGIVLVRNVRAIP